MNASPNEGTTLGVTKHAWLQFAREAIDRWFQHKGPPPSEISNFGSFIRDQRYRAGVDLGDLTADLGLPYEQMVLLEQGLLKPSEVPAPAWVRLMRILEGRGQMGGRPAPAPAGAPSAASEARASRGDTTVTVQRGAGDDTKPIGVARVRVIGVGGAGTNAVSRMFAQRIPGVEYMAINTDAQHLLSSDVPLKLRIGDRLTRGLGVGGDPEMGRESAEESREDLYEAVRGCDMVFIAAGMGGGTGTGAAPVLAEIAQESGVLTIAVVTKPFSFEGRQRTTQAEKGIYFIKDKVDTLILIPNDRLLSFSDQRMTAENAFKLADEVLRQGIQSIAELVTVPGEINLDFADVKTIMAGAGPAWMAIGMARGENRAVSAARIAIASPLLDAPIEGARRVLLNITGGTDLTLREVHQAAEFISNSVDPEANIIFGMVTNPEMEDEVRVTVIATDLPVHQQDLLDPDNLATILEETVGDALTGDEEQARAELPAVFKWFRNLGRRQNPGQ